MMILVVVVFLSGVFGRAHGETDVAFYLMKTRLTTQASSLITYHPKLLMRTSICLALSRQLEKSPGLLARFNEGLHQLKASGRYNSTLSD
jgi:hypothetical protein